MVPAALRCGACDLTVTGDFVTNEFAALGEEDLHFLRIFVHCEGRIREMESALGVSYPTIKNRLAKLKETLAAGGPELVAEVTSPAAQRDAKGEILEALEAGRVSFEEAMDQLKRLRAGEES